MPVPSGGAEPSPVPSPSAQQAPAPVPEQPAPDPQPEVDGDQQTRLLGYVPVGPANVPLTVTMDNVRAAGHTLAAPGPRTEWDLDSMQSTVSFLEWQRRYVDQLLQEMNSIMESLGRAETTPLGGFPTARALYTQHEAVWQGMRAALQSTRDQLDGTIAGTRQIIENYRTTEERNHASVQDITKLLAPGGTAARISGPAAAPATPSVPESDAGGGGSW